MRGSRGWRAIGLAAVTLGIMVTAWGWLGFRSRQAEEVAYQLRLSRWGGRSQELPRNSASLYRFRKFVGDEIYFGLTGSDGRIVGNDRVAHLDGDATREQLDELLERQPIRTALVAGSKHLGDDWLAGLEEPGAMLALALDGTAITDRSADFLVKMKNLSSLSLVDTAISDVAIARFCRLPNLDDLQVGGPNIRSIRLVDHRLLDDSGAPATRAGGKFRLEGLVEIDGLPGATHNVRVIIRPAGDPVAEIFPEQELSSIELESPWSWRFRVDLAAVPPGRSNVEVWIDHQPGLAAPVVHYRMRPFAIELADPTPTEAQGPSSPDR